MKASDFLFWTSVFLLVYTYGLYPLVLRLINCFVRNQVRKLDTLKSVTLIIAAYNEEKEIEAKIQNSLSLDYPDDMLQIIVVSDGSTDRTDEIVKKYAEQGVELLRVEGRRGKTAAQNEAVRVASGEILIFSDATSFYEPDVVRMMIRAFNDPNVGCTSGRLSFRPNTASQFSGEMNTSRSYEKEVKAMESDIWSICGVDGCLYAVPRKHYVEIDDFLTSDFVLPLKIAEKGLRVIFETEANCYEIPSKNPSGEFQRKIRTSRAGITGMYHMRRLLNPFRYPWAAFSLFSHKVLRWMSPFLLLMVLISNLALVYDNGIYQLSLSSYLALFMLGVLGYINERYKKKIRIFTIPFNFLLINSAVIIGFMSFLRGNITEAWETNRE